MEIDRKQLLAYLNSLVEKIEEERHVAMSAYNTLLNADPNLDSAVIIAAQAESLTGFLLTAGKASERLVKLADIIAKVVISDAKPQAAPKRILTEDDKSSLLAVVNGGS